MGFDDSGYLEWRPGLLAFVMVDDGEAVERLYNPTLEDLRDLCNRHNFPVDDTLRLIEDRDPSIEGFLFQADLYRKSFEEGGVNYGR